MSLPDKRLYTENWQEVFGEPRTYETMYGPGVSPAQNALKPECVPGDSASTAPFTRADVAEVLHLWESGEGTRDYGEWDGVCVVRLNDGRYASLGGGCDTSGWG